jgi:hypothetical protein
VSGQRNGISAAKVPDNPAPIPSAASTNGSTQQDAAAITAPKLATAPRVFNPAPVGRGNVGDASSSGRMVRWFIGRLPLENPLCIL